MKRRLKVFAPLLLLLLMLGPIPFGMLAAIAVWSVAISRFFYSSRYLASFAAALILTWAISIPIIETCGQGIRSNLTVALENVSLSAYSMKDRKVIEEAAKKYPGESSIQFSLAKLYEKDLNDKKALEIYQDISSNSLKGQTLNYVNQINIASLYFRGKEFLKAKGILEELETSTRRGGRSFELYYNLALTHMALLDLTSYRKYHNMILEELNERYTDKSIEVFEDNKSLFLDLPRGFLYSEFIQPRYLDTKAETNILKEKRESLLKSMFYFSNNIAIYALGVIVLTVGLYNLKRLPSAIRTKMTNAEYFSIRNPSLFWNLLPGGMFIVYNRSVISWMIFSLFLALAMFAAHIPIPTHGFFYAKTSLSQILVMFGIVIFLIINTAVNIIFSRKQELVNA